ncbi:50S ribosomal protein L25 [candidate division KSB1 bacterium]
MSDNTLTVEKREKTGKGYVKAIRRDGKIPGVYYIRGEEAVPLIVDVQSLRNLLASKPSLITLKLDDGSKKEAIIREIQRDPVTESIRHIDFLGIKRGVKITASVPLHLQGESTGVKAGGIVEHLLREIEIECLPKYLPESLEIDVSELDIGDSLHVSDLEFENIKILTKPDTGIVNVIIPKVLVVEAEAVPEEEVEAEEEEAAEEAETAETPEAESEK